MIEHSFFLLKSGTLSLCLVIKYASFDLRLNSYFLLPKSKLNSNLIDVFSSSNVLKDQIIYLFSFCRIVSEIHYGVRFVFLHSDF